MTITTTKCGEFGHPEFALVAEESAVPDVYIREMAETIERMVADGSVFRPGQTLQVGWMISKVEAHDSSKLTLVEPDMESFPIQWIPGITNTLRQKMLQVFLLDSVSLRGEILMPSILQFLIACNRYTATEFFMTRSVGSSERDSGWFVGCLDSSHDHNDPANLHCISLYEAYLNQKGIQNFVAFPISAMIVIDQSNGVTILKESGPLDVVPGSFLDVWLESRARGKQSDSYPE